MPVNPSQTGFMSDMFFHRNTVVWLMTICLFVSPVAPADTLFSVQSENDAHAFAGDDHYTNGFKLSWTVETDGDHWSTDVARALPGWKAGDVFAASYRLGHRTYTPSRIEASTRQPYDRPYAGVLHAGASIHGMTRHDGWHESRSLQVDAGIVGPSARAEQIQEGFHEHVIGELPRGWEHQLSDEPFFNLGYQHAWVRGGRLGSLELEYGPTAGVAIGNLYTYGAGGFVLRLGEALDRGFAIPSLEPAQGQRAFFRRGDGLGWYLFAAAEGRYVARNMLLDGNTRKDGPSVDREPWVADAQVGFALNWDRWQLAYTVAVRSREFATQDGTDSFGSITVSLWL